MWKTAQSNTLCWNTSIAGDVIQTTPATYGSTNFIGTTLHLLTSGDEPQHVSTFSGDTMVLTNYALMMTTSIAKSHPQTKFIFANSSIW